LARATGEIMLDLIFFSFFAGLFYAGFKCGNRFKTMREMTASAAARVVAFFN
jgi:hypothetical protein